MASAPKKPAAGAKAKEIKTDHIRKLFGVFAVFICLIAAGVVLHGLTHKKVAVAPHGLAQQAPPPPATAPTETPAGLEEKIKGYAQQAHIQQPEDAAAAAPAGAAPASSLGAITASAGRRSEAEEDLLQRLRRPMQIHDAGGVFDANPAPAAQPPPNVTARLDRLNAMITDLKTRQGQAGGAR